ncbi:GNAT family N-acetyltransferase [candidate division WOR-3 bacterium]|nr:GNAT family N-acetyltransferase [candidate division WOR-3 bacterium]
MIELIAVSNEEHICAVKRLFQEYTATLGFDLDFQAYDKEFSRLPGDYTPPSGRLYLAKYNGSSAGCVALRQLEENVCEMKRMYVKPVFRGKGIGRIMAERLISDARDIGYKRMRLDTIDTMKEAITLYTSLGFKPIPPYRHNPIKGAYFMELLLKDSKR